MLLTEMYDYAGSLSESSTLVRVVLFDNISRTVSILASSRKSRSSTNIRVAYFGIFMSIGLVSEHSCNKYRRGFEREAAGS